MWKKFATLTEKAQNQEEGPNLDQSAQTNRGQSLYLHRLKEITRDGSKWSR